MKSKLNSIYLSYHILTSHFLVKVSVSNCKSDNAASKTFVGVTFESIVSTRTWQSNINGWGMRYPANRTLESLRSWSRIRLPNVWSSFARMNVPVLGFLLSAIKESLFSSLSSSHLQESARSGTLMIFADISKLMNHFGNYRPRKSFVNLKDCSSNSKLHHKAIAHCVDAREVMVHVRITRTVQ
jgi:hypothetical protein